MLNNFCIPIIFTYLLFCIIYKKCVRGASPPPPNLDAPLALGQHDCSYLGPLELLNRR